MLVGVLGSHWKIVVEFSTGTISLTISDPYFQLTKHYGAILSFSWMIDAVKMAVLMALFGWFAMLMVLDLLSAFGFEVLVCSVL